MILTPSSVPSSPLGMMIIMITLVLFLFSTLSLWC